MGEKKKGDSCVPRHEIFASNAAGVHIHSPVGFSHEEK